MMQSSFEWDTVAVDAPVRQGDVLISRDPASLKVTAILFVLTADCDIDKKKYGRYIACLHVDPLKVYLRNVWSGKQLDSLVCNQRKDCRARIMRWIRKLNSDAEDLSYVAMDHWISRSTIDEICNEISVPDKEKKKFKKLTAVYKNILNILVDNHTDLFDKLCLCEQEINEKDIKEIKERLWKKACSEKLPEDVFIISGLPEIDNLGFAVRLREVVSVTEEDIVKTAAQAKEANKFFRIARMKPTYKYAISQSFGLLFSRIGMPDEYESSVGELFSLVEPD